MPFLLFGNVSTYIYIYIRIYIYIYIYKYIYVYTYMYILRSTLHLLHNTSIQPHTHSMISKKEKEKETNGRKKK